MNLALPLILAEGAHRPLFGNQWLALCAILVCVAVFMAAIAAVGHWLAATHPEPAPKPVAVASPVAPVIEGASSEIVAVIAAAITATLGAKARIASLRPVAAAAPSVEMLMQQWSIEGRRQIYTSHQIR